MDWSNSAQLVNRVRCYSNDEYAWYITRQHCVFFALFEGSTIQAVYHLEQMGLRAALMEAVTAATMKSKQAGRK